MLLGDVIHQFDCTAGGCSVLFIQFQSPPADMHNKHCPYWSSILVLYFGHYSCETDIKLNPLLHNIILKYLKYFDI